MANLSLPELEVRITADGAAAIEEIERAEQAVESASRGASGAAGGFDSMGAAARSAGSEAQRAGQGAEEFGRRAEEGAKKASLSLKDVGEKMSKIGKGMTTAITVPVVGALTASVKGASDMTETLGKTDVVFGTMTDSVLNWSESSVSAMGLAQQTALDMAATYGDMATGMGLSQAEAAKMSTALVQLGADMASFKNIGISDVNTALTAVFTGETESLKRLGIVMTQTNLQQFAYSQGIQKNIADLTQAEQVQLRYQYVMAMTANAQGDFQRTGGNLANQTRALGETIKEAANSFGALLVPAVTNVVSTLRDGAQHLAEMDDGTKRTIITIGMVVAAVGPLLLVGGKVVTMVSSIQGALAALAAHPAVLAIAGVVAAVTALGAAIKAAQPEVDTTSESYQSLKASIESGAKGKVEIDTTELDELDTDAEISISGDASGAADAAQDILDDLISGAYDGDLAIDGDPAKAQAALKQIEKDVAAAEAALAIGGDTAEAKSAVDALERDIATLQSMVVVTEDPEARAKLEGKLQALQAKLGQLKGTVTVTTEGEDGLDSLKKKLEEYDDKTYKATGEFVISGATAEVVKEYAEAVAAAASATGDYEKAVDSLNSIVDQESERKIGEVNAQLAETGRYYTAQLNDGAITQEQYDAAISKAVTDANERISAIQKEAEAQKQLNEAFADGSKANDASTFGEIMRNTYANEHVSSEEGRQAQKRLVDDDYGGDTERKQIDAGTALSGMIAEQTERRQQLTEAVQAYNAAMAEADNLERNGATTDSGASAQDALERAQVMQDALQQYANLTGNGESPAIAMERVTEQFGEQLSAYDGLAEELNATLAGDDGQGLDFQGARQKAAEAAAAIEEYQGLIDGAAEEAQTKRQEALTTLQTTMGELGTGYTEAETQAMLSAIEGAGVGVDEATEAMLASTPDMISELADAIDSGDSSQIQSAIDGVLSGVDPTSASSETGENVGQGLEEGMTNSIDGAKSAGETLGESAVEGVDSGAGCASPSTKTAETGRNLIAGLAEGMSKDFTPASIDLAEAVNLDDMDGEEASSTIIGAFQTLLTDAMVSIVGPLMGVMAEGADVTAIQNIPTDDVPKA